MDFSQLLKYVNVILKEAWQRKFLCLFGFTVVSFLVLVVGMFWPGKFEASATIFADNQNILRPLLDDQAAQTNVQNQSRVVKEKMHSPRILSTVVDQVYGAQSFASAEELGQAINNLRNRIIVKGVGSNYIKVSYRGSSPEEAYDVINAMIDNFIRSSSDEQRSESRQAFLFIENQVKQYKDQLLDAEERLKEFRAQNFDGRDGDVDASISRFRSQIEELKISIDEDRTIIKNLTAQLEKESSFSTKKFKVDVYAERLAALESRLSTLLLSYTEDYPDVVSLKYQIEDIKKTIRDAKDNEESSDEVSEDDVLMNPLYQELRSRLSQAQTAVKTKEKRLVAIQGLMEREFDRRKRIAERGAEESELTRDYEVTRRIYEDMLERKERARLSMTLNVEGQGVTYRIQEPPIPPLNPIGLRFLHFVVLGPFLGFFAVIGAILAFVMLDQRIRFADQLQSLEIKTLAVVPHAHTPISKRVFKIDMVLCFFFSVLVLALYLGLAFAKKLGMI